MQATSEIPIVFAAVGDPVGTGLVASLAHPGGNVTGLSNEQADLAGYRLELLHEVVPSVHRVALLGNIGSPLILLEMKAAEEAASKLGLEVFRLGVKKTEDVDSAIESLRDRADALYVCTDPLISTNRVRINILAIGEKLPTMNSFREYVRSLTALTFRICSAVLAISSTRFCVGSSRLICQWNSRSNSIL